jgi:hypothetical protein
MRAPDIRAPQDIDAAWLTEVVRAGGVEAKVTGFSARRVGTGQIGDSVRFALDYDREVSGAPASLVGKFPSANPESRGAGVVLGNYHREVRFYQQLAPRALVRTPRCWFTEVDEESHDFVLMMEDLAPAEQGDQLAGVSLEQAADVVRQAARLHASFWGDDGLDALPWVQGSAAAPASSVTEDAVGGAWAAFKARYAGRLEGRWIEVGDALCTRYGDMHDPKGATRCLRHNDFRPDNLMFATAAGGHPVTVLDWQSFSFGPGASDVGYFLAAAVPTATRRVEEARLLALYEAELDSCGARPDPPGHLRRHYGRGGASLFFTAYFAAMIVGRTERGDAMFLRMLGGAADHILDHDVLG